MSHRIVTWAERFDLYETADQILCSGWDEFLLNNKLVDEYWERFVNGFQEYQVMLMEGEEILAIINTLPLCFEEPFDQLPDGGWEWGFVKAIDDAAQGKKPNMLFGVQVVINPAHQGKGLSRIAVQEMRSVALKHGFSTIVIPLRPSLKSSCPLIPMEDYLAAKDARERCFDPWLRVHLEAGAEICRVCPDSYLIEGSIEEWKRWTGRSFPCSGSYVIPGALCPVEIDLEKDRGRYVEPNVWIVHHLGK
ncbi:MAG: GNAT family N-acetyltransferase [Verrucomicrobiota bacterium]